MTRYRPSPRYPRYWVGEDSTVIDENGRKVPANANGNGYFYVNLKDGDRSVSVRLNRLVCETYHGPRLPGMQAAHLDGNRANNAASNLKWKTHLENDADKDVHGTRSRGELHGKTRLTENDIRFIRQIYAARVKNTTQIAEIYRLDKSGVAKIINGQRWGHVK